MLALSPQWGRQNWDDASAYHQHLPALVRISKSGQVSNFKYEASK